jgi:branched-chain amino acid transport system permease protein
MLDRDYRAAVERSGAWPPITVFWRQWSPTAVATWATPLVAIILGVLLARLANGRRKHAQLPPALGSETP